MHDIYMNIATNILIQFYNTKYLLLPHILRDLNFIICLYYSKTIGKIPYFLQFTYF